MTKFKVFLTDGKSERVESGKFEMSDGAALFCNNVYDRDRVVGMDLVAAYGPGTWYKVIVAD